MRILIKKSSFHFQQYKKMSCFWFLYREYCESIARKNWIIDLKRKDEHVLIKFICNSSDINVNKQLEY